MSNQKMITNAAIIGGGLAGLTAANFLARAGMSVTLFEKSHAPGGRAITSQDQGFLFNLGPHALYRNGAGARILKELGIAFTGQVVGASGSYAIAHGVRHTLPAGFVSLLTTGLLPLAAKLETAKLLGNFQKIETKPLQNITVRDWLDREIRRDETRQLLRALIRVATYTNAPECQSAGAAIAQVQSALSGGMYYLDGGWQTLIDGLRASAEKSGAQILSGARIASVERHNEQWIIRTADDSVRTASSVIFAAGPREAGALMSDNAAGILKAWADSAKPIRVATLDLGLNRLPQPQARFGLGIDQPLYFSVHSAYAKLAPSGGAMIHATKYLPPDRASDLKAVEQELEAMLDLMQPGWRAEVRARRFLPEIMVTNAIVTAAQGGLAGRPGPAIPGCAGLYVAGDWVGPTGELADASIASAKQAAELILQSAQSRAAAA
jgi:phytoene dehydrogenase-like protein